MKKMLLLGALCTFSILLHAQQPTQKEGEPNVYRETPEIINDMVHTKLDARFDYQHAQLIGKVWLTLKPHFYATDSLRLDAKGMDIKNVAVVRGGKNVPLKYKYDGMQLDIDLDKTYKRTEQYIIYIDYVAKPDEYTGQGSAAITDAKGLYFINPRGEEAGKPTQIWTQGETEGTSVYVLLLTGPTKRQPRNLF